MEPSATLAKRGMTKEEEDENDENDGDANDAKRAATTTTKTKKTKKTKKKRKGRVGMEGYRDEESTPTTRHKNHRHRFRTTTTTTIQKNEEKGYARRFDDENGHRPRGDEEEERQRGNANAMVKKKNTEEDRARRKEAMHLKKELKNVNVKENNRNFERMFIGETIEVREDEDEENDAQLIKMTTTATTTTTTKGGYYPRDWTLKTRATFMKICSLDDDDDNDDAEDFDEDFDEEKARKISSSKSFWVGEQRTRSSKRRLCRRTMHFPRTESMETSRYRARAVLSSTVYPSSSNSIVSSESNKNDSRRSAAMQPFDDIIQYPDSRLPLHAIDKMNISFNDNQMSSAATNAWFRKRSDQWTEALEFCLWTVEVVF